MKRFKYITIALSFLIAGAFVSSCKKKEQSTTPPTPYGTFGLHLHTSVNNTELDSGQVGQDIHGKKIKLNIAQFYFSNITLKKSDGSEVKVGGAQLKTIGEEVYVIGQVPAGNYTGLSFQVGLDNATNQTLPSAYPASSVLSAQDPIMWFGSSSQGYIFMNVQGYIDTTSAMNGSADQPFTVQLGTGSMLKTVNLPSKSYSILANQTYFIHAVADYGILLDGLDFRTHSAITPFTDASAAAHAADNVTNMFMYE
jgi:hypothetical protein